MKLFFLLATITLLISPPVFSWPSSSYDVRISSIRETLSCEQGFTPGVKKKRDGFLLQECEHLYYTNGEPVRAYTTHISRKCVSGYIATDTTSGHWTGVYDGTYVYDFHYCRMVQ